MSRHSFARIVLASIMAFLITTAGVRAADPVVRAVLFYSPSCGHCYKVITEDLPPLFEKYGDRLQIIGVNIADASGNALFNAAADQCNIPADGRGVPLLAIADICLIGSADIPNRLPGLIEQHLAAGGVDWPDIPGLAEMITQAAAPPTATPVLAGPFLATPTAPAAPAAQLGPTAAPTPAPTSAPAVAQPASAPTPTPGLLIVGEPSDGDGFRARFDPDAFGRDPVGNGLAVFVLTGMVAAVGWVIARRPWRAWGLSASVSNFPHDRSAGHPAAWAVPLLCLVGLGVAGYLAYVETHQVRAVCGPVGDCNSVQQSAYARLFGLLPIGVLGALGYLAILAAWAVHRFNAGPLGRWAGLAAWGMVAGGVLFSIYLTFLEPFVIGATCAWCLSSAMIMTLLLLLTTGYMSRIQTGVRMSEAEGGGNHVG